ncbi:hypothetical protein BC332_17646 [Capsicum chinense]|nr:hypothetical protein BC332_17646 [Capsicum chinense]
MFKNYHTDGNKEMIAFGMMNIVGSCTSCYLTTGMAILANSGELQRRMQNCSIKYCYDVGCDGDVDAVNAIVPLHSPRCLVVHYNRCHVGLIDYNAAIHLWHVDKFYFLVCMSAYIGVVFGNIEIGLVMVKCGAISKHKVLILDIGAPIYFTNSSYLRERISRWIDDEEDNLKSSRETTLQYVILDMGAVGNIDTSGISMFEELVLANPGAEVMKKLNKSKFTETLGQEWMFLTVGEAVEVCSYMLHSCKPKTSEDGESQKWSNHV